MPAYDQHASVTHHGSNNRVEAVGEQSHAYPIVADHSIWQKSKLPGGAFGDAEKDREWSHGSEVCCGALWRLPREYLLLGAGEIHR